MGGNCVVTGGAGFVGSRLARALLSEGRAVSVIDRNPRRANVPAGVDWRQADLNSPAQYQDELNENSIVYHLGAVTGKARPAAYTHSNVAATRELLNACEASGVRQFIFLSSIAVKFTDRKFYHYAASKIEAETLVRNSPLNATIIRPTMILGEGSPIQAALAKLSSLPVIPMMGDGSALVQPVHVDDVVRCLAGLAGEEQFRNATIELGGPETMSIEDLFSRLRKDTAKSGARFVHLPATPSRTLLAAMEPLLLPLLPLTAGQIATFVNDGLADNPGLGGLPSLEPRMSVFSSDAGASLP